jgi:hypothetical protein
MTLIPRSNVRAVHGPPSFDVLVHFTPAVRLEHDAEFADAAVDYGSANFTGVVGHTCADNLNLALGSQFDNRGDSQC